MTITMKKKNLIRILAASGLLLGSMSLQSCDEDGDGHVIDDILQNIDYYKKYFAEQERLKTLNKLQRPEKRPWWKR